MAETPLQYGAERSYAQAGEISTAKLLGQVMFLVAIAIGFTAAGTVVGRDLAPGTALICSLVGLGMLLDRLLRSRRALPRGQLRHLLAAGPVAADRPRTRPRRSPTSSWSIPPR